MTGVTRWNKAVTPAGADGWNLTTDEGKALDTANVIVPVANGTERDGLTPPGGKYAGMAAARADVPGQALELYDGSTWNRVGPKIIPTPASQVGAALAVTAFTTGISAPIIVPGTKVVTTGTGSDTGIFSIDYPVAFPNGILMVLFGNGDSAQGSDLIFSTAGAPYTQTLATGFGKVVNSAAAALSGATVRVNYIAVGW